MRKIFFLALAMFNILTFLSCSTDDTHDTIVEIPMPNRTDLKTVAAMGLLGNVKEMEVKWYVFDLINGTTAKKENPTRKDINYFDNNSILAKAETFSSVDRINEVYKIVESTESKYDTKYRMTEQYKKMYNYPNNDLTSEPSTISAQRITREYDETEMRVVEIKSVTDDEANHPFVMEYKHIFALRPDGTYDSQNILEEILPKTKSGEYVYYKNEEIVLAKDAQLNWTEYYTVLKYFDEDGNVLFAQPGIYQIRKFSYW